MRLLSNIVLSAVALAAWASTSTAAPANGANVSARQAPNPDYDKDPINQTASYNVTSFLLPIKKDTAAGMVDGLDLLDIPRGALPDGYLKEDEHVLLCMSGLLYDIKQLVVEIQQLQSANCYMPFVDGSRDGQTPFTYDVVNLQDKLVPVIAGSLQQSIRLEGASWRPPHDAFGRVRQLKASNKAVENGNHDSMRGQYGFKIAKGLNIPANGLLGFLGIPLPPPIANLPLFSGEDGSDTTGAGLDENELALVATWDKERDTSTSDPFVRFTQGAVQAPYIHTYTRLPSGERTCGQTKWNFDEPFAQLYTVRGDVMAFESILPDGAQAFQGVQGVHVVAGWDNIFGPGEPCSQMRDLANSIQY